MFYLNLLGFLRGIPLGLSWQISELLWEMPHDRTLDTSSHLWYMTGAPEGTWVSSALPAGVLLLKTLLTVFVFVNKWRTRGEAEKTRS